MCIYWGLIFREPFPVETTVDVENIFGIISRGLAVNCSTLSSNLIRENIAIGALIPDIHVILFKLLDVLIMLLVILLFESIHIFNKF